MTGREHDKQRRLKFAKTFQGLQSERASTSGVTGTATPDCVLPSKATRNWDAAYRAFEPTVLSNAY